MRQTVGLGASLACAAALVACGGGAREQARNDTNGAGNPLLNSDTRPQPVTATGCLTAANGRYVLTSLDNSAAVPTTVTYQLSGGTEQDLQKNVNREVRVAGEADPPKVADVRQAPTPAVGTSGDTRASNPEPEPRVKTQESVRFEVRQLKVLSVTATGDACPAAPADQGQAK